MTKLQTWVYAARLRTLPLSVSGILTGSAIAAGQGEFNAAIFGLALATTLGLQILSNFANDYGDFLKGTDNEERVGPQRALQSGRITREEMLTGMIVTGIVTFILALFLIFISFGTENFLYALLFIALGIAAISAAVKYTVGESAYGYRGLGDVFVFIFFGLVGVYGCYFLYTLSLDWRVLFPSFTIGLLSAGVLNLNNMRDRISDERAGKNTLVVKIGAGKAKHYHYSLLISAMFFTLFFTTITFDSLDDLLYLPAFIPLVAHIVRVNKNKDPEHLDPELKKLALTTFLFAILFGLAQVL